MSAGEEQPLGPGAPAAQAGVRVSRRDGAAVAGLSGEIDISNVTQVREAMMEISDIGAGLIIDLTRIEFMDSSAISLLHELSERVRRRGEQVVVVCPPDVSSRRMLEISGLGERIALLDRVPDALAHLAAPLEPDS